MGALRPGHYWKTPFYWGPGSPLPPKSSQLEFHSISDAALRPMIAAVMANSMDASDKYNVSRLGAEVAAQEVFDWLDQDFDRGKDWWRVGKDHRGHAAGFVLPVTFNDEQFMKEGSPMGTILYMGVLPDFRGRGYGLELLHEATRIFASAGCWRIICDTGSDNKPMIQAFRKAGYDERAPWQRPLA